MSLIVNAFTNALLSDATYALNDNNLSGVSGSSLVTLPGFENRMTPTLAKYIGDNFTVVTHIETDDLIGSGFDATVWKENASGKLLVSMQGTTGAQDFLSDASLATSGNARNQIVDMVNWWFKITTPQGQSARQIQVEPQYDNSTPPVLLGSYYVAAPNVPGAGLVSAGDLARGIEVNGHSLGGYLATAFTRLLGSQAHVAHTSTFNSAGFALGSEGVFAELQNLIGPTYGLGRFPNAGEQTNYFAANGINVTTNSLWFNQAGQRVELFNEEGTGFPNHYMYKLTDALTLGAALEKLDTSTTLTNLNALVQAGGNDMKASYEGLLDGLRRQLLGGTVTSTPASDDATAGDRGKYHANLKQLTDSTAFKDLIGKVTLVAPPVTLAAAAKTDFASLLALIALSPVVIRTTDPAAIAVLKQANAALAQAWADDAQLSAAQRSSGMAHFSDAYLLDRQALLQGLLSHHLDDSAYSIPLKGTVNANYTYTDTATGQSIVFRGAAANANALEAQKVIFGDDKGNTLVGSNALAAGLGDRLYGGAGVDTLRGLEGDDYLQGDEGSDTLDGGAGDDQLLGGAGNDIYLVGANSGRDAIIDSDGAGHIELAGKTLTGAGKLALASSSGQPYAVWIDDALPTRQIIYRYNTFTAELQITGYDSTVVVRNFSDGKLGITRPGAAAAVTPPPSQYTFDLSTSTGLNQYLTATPAQLGGNLTLNNVGAAGNTWGSGQGYGGSDVVVNGPIASTSRVYLGGGGGNDQLYGTLASTTLSAAIAAGETQLASGRSTLAMSGDEGNDQILGDAGDDALFGGDGDDVISGGGGNDVIIADGSTDTINFGDGSAPWTTPSAGNADQLRWLSLTVRTAIVGSTNTSSTGQAIRTSTFAPIGFVNPLSDVDFSGLLAMQADNIKPSAGDTNVYLPGTQVTYGELFGGKFFSTHVGTGNDQIFAGAGDDIVNAGSGNDIVISGTGNDMVAGYEGDDFIEGGDGDDVIDGDFQVTVSDGGQSVQTIVVHGANIVVRNILDASLHGRDYLDGGAGDDEIYGGGNADEVYGGTGNDSLFGDHYNLDSSYAGDDFLDGGEGDDELIGGGGSDTLYGGAGVDILEGDDYAEDLDAQWHGADWLDGGIGNDELYGFGGDDTLIGGDGNDWLAGEDEHGVNDVSVFTGDDVLDGGSGDDDLIGGRGHDVLRGGDGMDALYGGAGDDVLIGGADTDSLRGGDGADILEGEAGFDSLFGDGGNDTYLFGRGDGQDQVVDTDGTSGNVDNVLFKAGVAVADVQIARSADALLLNIIGTTDQVRIENYFVNDGVNSSMVEEVRFIDAPSIVWRLADIKSKLFTSSSTSGADTLIGYATPDNVDGGDGSDHISGRDGNDVLRGGNDRDWLFGENGDDTLRGDAGDDQLTGGAGNDFMDGGLGNDELIGGEGNDTYVLSGGLDFARDYSTSSNDTYQYQFGQGTLIVEDKGGTDRVELGNLIAPADVAVAIEYTGGYPNNATLTFKQDTSQRLSWSALFNNNTGALIADRAFESIHFADGTVWTVNDIKARASITTAGNDTIHGYEGDDAIDGGLGNDDLNGKDGNDTLSGGAGNDSLRGDGGNDTLLAGLGDDVVLGMDGNDILHGGIGNDQLQGGRGDDTYRYSLGDGNDEIEDLDNGWGLGTEGGFDTVELGAGITAASIVNIQSTNDAVTLVFVDGGRLTLHDMFTFVYSPTDYYRLGAIENVKFSDGTVWTWNDLKNMVSSPNQAPVLALALLDQSATANALFDWSVPANAFSDPDAGTVLNYAARLDDGTAMPAWLTFDATTRRFTGTPAVAGTLQIRVTATDPSGLSVSDVFALTIASAPGGAISGTIGNDTLPGTAGADTMLGGAGNDTYVVNHVGDVVTETASQGTDLVQSSVTYTLTANVENLTLTGSAVINGTGNALGNVLRGNAGANVLDGGDGNDTMYGGAGNDTYVVAVTADLVHELANEGTDLVLSSTTYELGPYTENLTLTGTAAIDAIGNTLSNVLTGNAGANVLTGRAGNDTLNGGAGADTLLGGTGNDTYVFGRGDGQDSIADGDATAGNVDQILFKSGVAVADVQAVREGDALVLKISGTSDQVRVDGYFANNGVNSAMIEEIRFTDASATVWNYAQVLAKVSNQAPVLATALVDQTATADAAFDWSVPADAFNDPDAGTVLTYAATLQDGSALPSWLSFDAATRRFLGTPNAAAVGTLQIKVTASDPGGMSIDDVFVLTVASAPIAVINGTAGADVLAGTAGADTMLGGAGNDTYVVNHVGDVVTETANQGTDLVQSSVTYTLTANVENLTLTGSAAINGTGNALGNVIRGNAGANVLDGGDGNDTMYGGAGNDTYVVAVTADLVHELANEGTDLVLSSTTYELGPYTENLTLTGTAAIDAIGNTMSNVLTGNAGANVLTGRAGNDTLNGGAGADTLLGGTGNDTYVFGRGDGQDSIADGDATSGNVDQIQFKSGVAVADVQAVREGDALVLKISGTSDQVRLDGYFANNGMNSAMIEEIRFTDASATVWNYAQVLAKVSNQAPVLATALVDQTATADAAFDWSVPADAFNDPDAGTVLTYAATLQDGSALPSWLSFDAATRRFLGTPNAAAVGTLQIKVTVTDPGGMSIDDVFVLTVASAPIAVINGTAGADVLAGTAGADTMLGGAGNDTYVVNHVGDVVTETANQGTDLVQSSVTYTLTANVENLTLTGSAVINGTGNALANVLRGNAGDNVLDGAEGGDSMYGSAGNDTFIVTMAADKVFENANEGVDLILSSDSYELGLNAENLTLTGTAAIDALGNTMSNVLTGNAGANVLTGRAGNDTLNGGAGADALLGGTGNDTYVFGRGDGQDSIADGDATAGNVDQILFKSGVAVADVQAVREGDALVLKISGTSDQVRVDGYFANNGVNSAMIEEIRFTDASATVWNYAQVLAKVAVNEAPELTNALADQLAAPDTAFDWTLPVNAFTDPNAGNVLVYTATLEGGGALPGWLTFDAATLRFSGTPTSAVLGTVQIKVTATDPEGLFAEDVFTLTVATPPIQGTAGADTLTGTAGADTMLGGAGNDLYVVNHAGDVVTENPGDGMDHVQSSVTFALSANVENLTLAGTTNINATGNALNNVITGNIANNSIAGGLGADTMVGGKGNDSYTVDDAGDVVTEKAGEGTDIIYSSVSLTMAANVENLTLTGTAAIDAMGNALGNVIRGNAGDNVLDGAEGSDSMYGGAGNDTFMVTMAADKVFENANEGVDLILSSATYELGLNTENLTLTGTAAIDAIGNTMSNVLTGNSGANVLTGVSGHDTLDGGVGDDTLIGGTGNDRYVLRRGDGADLVTENDATAGNADVAAFGPGIASDQLWFRQVNDDLEVSVIGSGDKLTIGSWYLGGQYRVEQFQTSGGAVLAHTQVQNLVDAMAAFAPPAPGQTTLPAGHAASLQPVLAANWQ